MLNKNTQDCKNSACVYSFSRAGQSPGGRSVVGQHSGPSRGRVRPADRPTGIVTSKYDARGGGGGGGGALRYRGGPHPRYVFRGRRGLFLRPPHVRDFVKEGHFFVPRYEVWGSKSPYNPGNIRGSDAECSRSIWLTSLLPPLAAARHAEDYKILS